MSAHAATILVLGDSISAGYGIDASKGWVALLQTRLKELDPQHQVINASVSGETTSGGVTRLPDLLVRLKPDLVLIELGGNDGLRGYPIATLRANLQQLIALTRKGGARPLLFAMEVPPNYGRRYVDAFRATFTTVAQEQQTTLVPFFLANVALHKELMQSDGIHPRVEAQTRIVETVWPSIVGALPNQNVGATLAAPAPTQHPQAGAAASQLVKDAASKSSNPPRP